MEQGDVPPPRKANAKSLVTPQDQTRRISQGKSTYSPHQHSPQQFSSHQFPNRNSIQGYRPGSPNFSNNGFPEGNPLTTSLGFIPNTTEMDQLRTLLKEEHAKLQTAARQQSLYEEELVSSKAKIENLSSELQTLKQKKQLVDSEIAESEKDNMNTQAKLMVEIETMNDEVRTLKSKFSKSQEENRSLSSELQQLREKMQTIETEKQQQREKLMRPDNVQTNSINLERRQNELLINELKQYHAKLKTEMAEVSAVNERLCEDNEQLQYLLVERTVAGKLHDPVTMADEEMFEFVDEQPEPAEGTNGYDAETDSQTDVRSEYSGEKEHSVSPPSRTELQRLVNSQKFEINSLKNHNRALKISLERLVDRMLGNRVFAEVVEEAVSKPTVSSFRSRVASQPSISNYGPITPTQSSSMLHISPLRSSGSSRTSMNQPKVSPKVASPQVWSKMLFNSQYTGNPNRRVLSLGVDEEVNVPLPPNRRPSTASTKSGVSSFGGEGKTIDVTAVMAETPKLRIFP